MEYKDWLNAELEKAQKREEEQELNYQCTGSTRYERARQKAEYLSKALLTALKAEEGKSEMLEMVKRNNQELAEKIKGYIETLPAEEAIHEIKNIITITLFKLS